MKERNNIGKKEQKKKPMDITIKNWKEREKEKVWRKVRMKERKRKRRIYITLLL